jgi:prolyl oligopeptidase
MLLTYKNAPHYQVLRVDARRPELASAEVVLPQGNAIVSRIKPAQDALYVQLLDSGISRVVRVPYGAHPQVRPVVLPFEGSAFVPQIPPTDPRLPGTFLYLTSWTKGFKLYEYDPKTEKATDTRLQPIGPHDDPTDIESIEVKVPSYDGTLVPLSIVYPKQMKLDDSNPTLLEVGAAFSSQMPLFAVLSTAPTAFAVNSVVAWMSSHVPTGNLRWNSFPKFL